MTEVILVGTDDWEAIYVNGKKELEGHSVHSIEVLEFLSKNDIGQITFKSYNIDYTVIENKYNWEFPESFTEFNLEDLEA